MRPAYKYPAIALAALALFIFSFFVLISGNDIEKILKAELQEKSNVSFTAKDFSKSFPLGIKASGVTLSAKDINGNPALLEIVYLDDLKVSLSIFPLIIGKKNISFLATLGGGELKGKATLNKNAGLKVKATKVALNAFTPLKNLGIKGWKVSGTAAFISSPSKPKACPQGKVKLDVTDINIKGLKSPLPLMLFGKDVSASIIMKTGSNCLAEISEFIIEGYALNAKINGTVRLKNPIKRSVLDLKVELFTKPGTADKGVKNLLSSFMKEYKRSPGHYLMSVKGTIGKPSVKR